MEMPMKWDDFHVIEDEVVVPERKNDRRCPKCNNPVTGRPNKIYCSSNCRKRANEFTRNSFCSVTKRRENAEFFDRAKRLAEELYTIPPSKRLGFMKNLIDHARRGGDAQLRDILSNYKLLRPHPLEDRHLFHRRSRSYLTIAQVASRYCRRFWKADVREVVYNRVPDPPTGEIL